MQTGEAAERNEKNECCWFSVRGKEPWPCLLAWARFAASVVYFPLPSAHLLAGAKLRDDPLLPALQPWRISLLFLGFLLPGQGICHSWFHSRSADEALWKPSYMKARGSFFCLAFHHFKSLWQILRKEGPGNVCFAQPPLTRNLVNAHQPNPYEQRNFA